MTACEIGKNSSAVPSLTVQELKRLIDGGDTITIIDVREPSEHATCSINSSRLIPLAELKRNPTSVPQNGLVVLHCHHGGRSSAATEYLMGQGWQNVVNLTGGIHAWALEIDPTMAKY